MGSVRNITTNVSTKSSYAGIIRIRYKGLDLSISARRLVGKAPLIFYAVVRWYPNSIIISPFAQPVNTNGKNFLFVQKNKYMPNLHIFSLQLKIL